MILSKIRIYKYIEVGGKNILTNIPISKKKPIAMLIKKNCLGAIKLVFCLFVCLFFLFSAAASGLGT